MPNIQKMYMKIFIYSDIFTMKTYVSICLQNVLSARRSTLCAHGMPILFNSLASWQAAHGPQQPITIQSSHMDPWKRET